MAQEIVERIIAAVLSGKVTDRDGLQRLKMRLCAECGPDKVPANSAILAQVAPADRAKLLPLLVKKPMRTASGVSVVAVMTSPYPCPHGRCSYCPGGVANSSPQSYTGKEPAARRAVANHFDPYDQVADRLRQLTEVGHVTDKVDLIIMGGTFTSRDHQYQEWFVRRCFDALNGTVAGTLERAQALNVRAAHRCVGLTVETRPDYFCRPEQVDWMMQLGATRVELGVQILDDEVLKGVDRGHGTAAVRAATQLCKERGLKVCYHIMPGLPGSSPEHDYDCFRRVFDDPAYRPDMLKFYPTLVVPGTRLYDQWQAGKYTPLDTETAVALLAKMKAYVPEYVRIQRIQRDIPVPEIAAGILKSNLRQLVQERMAQEGAACRCIRCREVGRTGVQPPADPAEIELKVSEYEASGGRERFLALEYHDSIAGYLRLRTDDGERASVRELKVAGQEEAIGVVGNGWQHRGFGHLLLTEAEKYARQDGKAGIRITSGVGVREYYAALGYRLDAPYMVKDF
ncbi:MAG: tRNA uridine(34) 5-carboxymethylaminomethyl modification radical SAM/GNAT enzyme Elp3 [Candidatus Methanomethylophilus sp.]|nr:tRNA uridine(34) 5-carboxymethylaminomethyl modification radical SAM/GNAT enzyme Elp3 [Methanomethylophilus sp.]